MGLPLIKLGLLAVKQVAKPVAQRIKVYASTHPTFSGLMVRMGRMLHVNTLQVELNRRIRS